MIPLIRLESAKDKQTKFINHAGDSIPMKIENQHELTIHRKRAHEVIKNLEKRQIKGFYFDSVEKGIEQVADLIPRGSTVGLAGSTTVIESGLIERLRKLRINLLDRYKEGLTKEEINRMRDQSLQADVLIASTNAITLQGQLVNVDGMGNRVAGMIYGPKKVIILAGVNKIVDSIEEGIARVHSLAGPINVRRVGTNPPCRETGICDEENCWPPQRMCNKYVIIEGEYIRDRLHVVLVGERLGF